MTMPSFLQHQTVVGLLCHAVVLGLFLRAIWTWLCIGDLRRRMRREDQSLLSWSPADPLSGDWIHPAAKVARGEAWDRRDFEAPFETVRQAASANRGLAASAGLVCTALGIAVGAMHFGSTADQAAFVRAIGDSILATVFTVIISEIDAANLRIIGHGQRALEARAAEVAQRITLYIEAAEESSRAAEARARGALAKAEAASASGSAPPEPNITDFAQTNPVYP